MFSARAIATPVTPQGCTVQWALITASASLGANLFFEVADSGGTPINTIGFNSSPELTDFSLPVEVNIVVEFLAR